ncbi:MAG: hypothetical protein IT323_00555 [Anaerolineae bacterium]|nr:hypothetical protein [Anaerolineae bacterium]
MPIHVEWDDDEQTTLRMAAIGVWTWQDYGEALQQAHSLMDGASREMIHLIIDMHQSPLLPSNVLSHLSGLPSTRHAKSGMKVVVGVNAFAKALFAAMKRINPQGMRSVQFASTLDEARTLLRSQQPTAPKSNPDDSPSGSGKAGVR